MAERAGRVDAARRPDEGRREREVRGEQPREEHGLRRQPDEHPDGEHATAAVGSRASSRDTVRRHGDRLAHGTPRVKVPGSSPAGEHVAASPMVAAASSGFAATVGKLPSPRTRSPRGTRSSPAGRSTWPSRSSSASWLLRDRRAAARRTAADRWPGARSAAFARRPGPGPRRHRVGARRRTTAMLFSLHVVQHMLLGMVAPILLVLGAPVTLALQALFGARRSNGLVRDLRRPPTKRAVTHPITVWVLFGGHARRSLLHRPLRTVAPQRQCARWVNTRLRGGRVPVHGLRRRHRLVPAGLGYGARLLYVLVLLPFHAFIGVACSAIDRAAVRLVPQVVRPWGPRALDDQRLGAGILWAAGELVGVVAWGRRCISGCDTRSGRAPPRPAPRRGGARRGTLDRRTQPDH